MADPILFVAGFGRCGTTMMMSMLDHAGFPVAGPRPAYEVDQMIPFRGVDMDWLRAQSGRAVKWIDPLNARVSRNSLPSAPVIIHMCRDTREMARSQVKLLAQTGMPIIENRRTWRALAKDIARKKPTLVSRLTSLGEVHHFSFEWVLADPSAAVAKLAAIVRHHFGVEIDVRNAVGVPLARSPLCAPDLSIELFGHA